MSILRIILKDREDTFFSLDRKESIKLELELNKSDKGKEWRYIGDKLYNHGIGKEKIYNLIFESEIFFYLYKLGVNAGFINNKN